MKKRILSFLLVLVMLFSCLSLNIFAAEGENNTVTEEKTLTEAEQYQQYGVGLPGKYGMSVTDFTAALNADGRTALKNADLATVKDNYNVTDTPYGLSTYDGMAMWLESGNKDDAAATKYETNASGYATVTTYGGETYSDIPLINWVKIVGVTETVDGASNTYLKWQRPQGYYVSETTLSSGRYYSSKISNIAESFKVVKETVDGVEKEKFANAKLQGYVDAGKEMIIYKTSDAGNLIREAFTVENVRNYFARCFKKADGTAYTLGEEYDGVLYYVGFKTGEYVEATVSGVNSNATVNALAEANDERVGASYVITFDFMHYGNADITPFEMRSYAVDSGNVSWYSIGITANGALAYYTANDKGKSTLTYSGKVIPANTWAQITLWHTPRGIDGLRGTEDDNTFHIFLDGEYVVTAIAVKDDKLKDYTYNGKTYNTATEYTMYMARFCQPTVDADHLAMDDFRVYYGTPIECVHSWEYSHEHSIDNWGNVLKAECAWCHKTETKTVAKGDKTGLYDLTATQISNLITSSNNVALTNQDFTYNTDKTIESQTPYGLGYNNGYFAKSGSTIIINWRQIVNAKDANDNEYIKWQRPVAYGPDNKVLDLSIGEDKKFTNTALQGYVGKSITYFSDTEAKTSTTKTVTFDTAQAMADEILKYIEIVDGTPYYIGYKTGEYLQYREANLAGNNYTFGAIYKNSSFVGASYAVTFDFAHYGNGTITLFELMSYLPATETSYKKVLDNILYGTANSATFNVNNERAGLSPIKITPNGQIQYQEGNSNSGKGSMLNLSTDIASIPAGQKVQFTFYHTPRGLDGIRGTEDDNTYHLFLDGEHILTANLLPTNYTTSDITFTLPDGVSDANGANKKDIKLYDFDKKSWFVGNGLEISYNSGSDYINGVVRIAQQGVNYDLMAIDDFRLYNGDFLECAHTTKTGETCITNGVCNWCHKKVAPYNCDLCDRSVQFSGIVLDSDVAVVNKNLSLVAAEEELNMNIYFELSERAKANTDTKVRLTGAGGDRVVEVPISSLEYVQNGAASGRYKATLPLRSIDMASEIKVELIKDGEVYGEAYTTSVEDYLKALIEIDENARALAEATLNYGAYAQKYFADKNGDETLDDVLPNTGIVDNVATAEPEFGENDVINIVNANGIQFTYASFVLTNTTKVRVYFYASENATVTIGDKELTKELYAESEYFVTLAGAGPKAFDDRFVITVTDGDSVASIELNVNAVINLVLGTQDEQLVSAEYKNLMKALYLYGDAAEKYQA